MSKEFVAHLEWIRALEDIHGTENFLYEQKNDDGTYICYYKSKQWAKSFKYDSTTRIGEF